MAKKDKPRNDLLDRLVYLALRVVASGVHSYGPNVSLALARVVGNVMYAIDKRHRDRAIGNLKRSFPEMPDRTIRLMARRSMEALCMLGVEVMITTRVIRVDTFMRYVELGEGFRD